MKVLIAKKLIIFGIILPETFYFGWNVECVKVSLGYKSNDKKIIVNFIHKEIS